MTSLLEQSYLTPTTVLQAVNVVLEAIGQAPIPTLDEVSPNTDEETAMRRIFEVSRRVQEEGWHFNQEVGLTIPADVDGEVSLPTNVLKVYQLYASGTYSKDLVARGTRVYDRTAHSYNIGVPIKVDMTVMLPFEELPEAARVYITLEAARMFTGKLISTTASNFSGRAAEEARLRLEQADAEVDQRTMEGNPHIRRMKRK